jgi:hypothetical protein
LALPVFPCNILLLLVVVVVLIALAVVEVPVDIGATDRKSVV